MTDDLHNRGPQDRARINVHEPWEMEWWTKELKCTEPQLTEAIAAVGVMVKDIRARLAKR